MLRKEIHTGHTYAHRHIAHEVTVVGCHPFDGAAFVTVHHDPEVDDDVFMLCIPEDFTAHIRDNAEMRGPAPLIYPAEYGVMLKMILGTMCFQLAPYANQYRKRGAEIKPRAEDEQAFMLDKMLRMWLIHGDDKWVDELNKDMGIDPKPSTIVQLN